MVAKSHERSLAAQRWEQLRALLRERRVVRVDDLCKELGASPATVRRDLARLERLGEVQRVHGGAVRVESQIEEPLFDHKASVNRAAKQQIAKAALDYIGKGETIYLDGGSTVLELARLLREWFNITVITNSLRAALVLASQGPRLILVGGELRRLSQAIVGPLTQHVLSQLNIDKAFMGTFGMTKDGLSTTDPDEAFTKQLVMTRARRVILLADSSKLGQIAIAHSGSFEQVDVLISDDALDKDFVRELVKKGIEVKLVKCNQR